METVEIGPREYQWVTDMIKGEQKPPPGQMPQSGQIHPWGPGWYEMPHATCGQVAFYYDHKPVTGERMDPAHARLPDGSTPHWGERVLCGSCSRSLHFWQMSPDDLVPV